MNTQAAERDITTRANVELAVRPVEQADEALLEAFFDKVSDEDRRFRFLTAQQHVGHDQLMPMVSVDHWQTESFLAFDKATDELVATGMLACDKAMEVGEIAISVRSDYRGKGLGWAMLDVLGNAAEKRGVKEVIAIEDRENHAAIELEREKGFTPRAFEGDAHLVILAKSFA
ncbi:MAG: GNAT family N-acetyltransferase [Sphingomonadales bacterium]|nr:GNAT family N-acetyltransferase [Sphingomonadales bacterium]MBD3773442.1 GNAT family N-acetyltransferase [Paracoccaceae bacterium]